MKCQGFQRSLALWENVPEEVALEAGDKEQGSRWGHRFSCHHNSRPQIQDSNREEGGPFLASWKTVVQGREGGPTMVTRWFPSLGSCHCFILAVPLASMEGGGEEGAGELRPKP